MRRAMLIIVAALAAFALIGCGGTEPAPVAAPTGFAPNQSVEAYAYTHGGYVGMAMVTTDAEGNISATLDEAFLPHTMAEVDLEAAEWNEDNTVFYISRGDEVRVAKYISYAGTNYVGTTVGSAVVYVAADESGNPAGGKDLELEILRNQTTMANYYENLRDGQFMIYTGFGQGGQAVTEGPYGSPFKSGGGYWNFGDLGWQGNMDAIEEAAATIGTGFGLDEMVRGDDNFWSLADATTGATASDFIDYFSLIQLAVGRLAME